MSNPESSPLPCAVDHAGVDARNGYLPPRAVVSRLAISGAPAWERVPPVPALTDPGGERTIGRAVVRLAWDAERLYADARVVEPAPVIRPDRAPGSNRFWEQDHLELRFLADPARDLDQTQFILAADGRAWDNRGLWKTDGLVLSWASRFRGGWRAGLSFPFAALGLKAPAPGDRWRGLAGHTRWGGGGLDIACSGAAELGYPQAERFGEWLFADTVPPVILHAVSERELVLANRGRAAVRGTLAIRQEREGSETVRKKAVRLQPGLNRLPVRLETAFPRFTRQSFAWTGPDGRTADWGAVSLAGPLPGLKLPNRVSRPGLLFDEGELPALRAKLTKEPFKSERALFQVPAGDLNGEGIPGPDDPVSMAVTPGCMNWFRVAKETMIRDGEGGRKPSSAYLWARQSEKAREAWRNVVRTVKATEADLRLLMDELNGLLARRDFYDAGAFAGVHLPAEGRDLLARELDALTADEVFRFNRIVLQSAVECIGAFRMDLAMKPGDLWAKWLVTGDERLVRTATKAVAASLRLTIMDHQIHLHEGMAAAGGALAYDSFHPMLAAEERRLWQAWLRRFLALHLETARKRSWTVTTIANANPVGNAGCGLAALALRDVFPEEAAESLDHARRYIRYWLDYCQGSEGGNTEGAQYWQYGMDNFLRFARALERADGKGDGLLGHPGVTKALNMIRVGLCNDGALHGLNDTVPMPIGGPIAWFLAARTGDPLGLWYGDHALRWLRTRRKAGKLVAYDIALPDMLLARPVAPPARRQPPLPEAFMLPDIQYGILRSGPRFDCRWTAGLKGSRPPYTHHNQRDTGAAFIDLRGERLLIDPGYYKPEPEDHALPLVNGQGPVHPSGWTGAITACGRLGALRWLAVDSTAAYNGAARRVVRHLVMAGQAGVVLLDDIAAGGTVRAQYPFGGVTERLDGGRAVRVKGAGARMGAVLLTRPGARFDLKPERSLHDTHWGYHFADCRLFPAAVEYQPDPADPLVTVFLDEAAGESVTLEREADRLVVRFSGGAKVIFRPDPWRLV